MELGQAHPQLQTLNSIVAYDILSTVTHAQQFSLRFTANILCLPCTSLFLDRDNKVLLEQQAKMDQSDLLAYRDHR